MTTNKGKVIIAALLVCVAVTAAYAVYQLGRNTSLSYQLRLAQMELEDVREQRDNARERRDAALIDVHQAQEEVIRLQRQVERQEASLEHLRNPQRSSRPYWVSQYVRLVDGRYLRYSRPSLGRRTVEYIHIVEDVGRDAPYTVLLDENPYGTVALGIIQSTGNTASQPSISPCGNFLTYAFWGTPMVGSPGLVVIYDMRTGEVQSKQLVAYWDERGRDESIHGANSGATHATWLDERTILVLFEAKYPFFPRVGTVYAFDIVDNTLTSVDIQIPETGGVIVSIQMEGDTLYMDIVRSAERRDPFSTFPHHISAAEVHRLIAAGETRSADEIAAWDGTRPN